MIARAWLWLCGRDRAAAERERVRPVDSIPFGRAVLCLDCDHVTASRGETCDRCQSTGALLPLARSSAWMLAAQERVSKTDAGEARENG